MFEISMQFMEQLIDLIIPIISIYIVFDFIGGLLFDKR